jgi:hypothetical protein
MCTHVKLNKATLIHHEDGILGEKPHRGQEGVKRRHDPKTWFLDFQRTKAASLIKFVARRLPRSGINQLFAMPSGLMLSSLHFEFPAPNVEVVNGGESGVILKMKG